MTTERIDVLAVMDKFCNRYTKHDGKDLREARAAVAELMRAARDYQNATEDYVSAPRRVVAARNLRTALARVGAP